MKELKLGSKEWKKRKREEILHKQQEKAAKRLKLHRML